MTIFAVGFALLLAIVTSIVNNYVAESKEREMLSDVTALRDCADDAFASEVCAAFNDPNAPLSVIFRSLAGNDGDLTLSIADRHGKILYLIGAQAENGTLLPDLTVSQEIIDVTKTGEAFYRSLKTSFSERAIPSV